MAKKTTLKEIGETLAFIVEKMATKGDLAELREQMLTKDDVRAIVREEIKDLRAEVSVIRKDLDELMSKVDNIVGYRQEIDHALERIAAIEKHLGINKKIAA